jgi:hypothetical protein
MRAIFSTAEDVSASQEGLCSMERVSEKGIATKGLYFSQGVRKVGRMFSEMYLHFSASLKNTKKTKLAFLIRIKD